MHARKRDEPLLTVPQSITALSAHTLQTQDVRSVYDLQNLVPNFSFEQSSGRRSDRPIIRGMANIAADSNASFYVDGVFVVGSISTTTLDALERVEVLRGPQGAMFGRASFAGAINYVTKAPTDTWDGGVNGRLATYGSYKASGWLSGPIIPSRLQMFLSGGTSRLGGQYHNGNPGTPADPSFPGAPTRSDYSKLASERTDDFTAKLRLLVSEDVQINAKTSYTESSDDHMAAVIIRGNEQNCYAPVAGTATARSRGYFCGEAVVGDRTPQFNIPDFTDGLTSRFGTAARAETGVQRKIWRNMADIRANLGGWQWLVQVAEDNDFTTAATDFDLTLLRPSFGASQFYTEDDRTSHSFETRLTSPNDAALRMIAGLYYFKSRMISRSRSFAVIIPLTEFSTNLSRNYALFGQIQYSARPGLTVSLEGRLARDERSLEGANSRAASARFDSFTPRLTIDYRLRDDAMVYALVARGNKPGGLNAAAYSTALANEATYEALRAQGLDRVKEETQTTYEVGTKGRAFNGKLSLSASAFFIDWSNQALSRTVDVVNSVGLPGVASVLVNAGKTHVYGIELESSLRVSASLTVSAAYGWARSRLRRFNDDEIAILTGVDDPLLVNGGNARGRASPFAPEHIASLSANWREPIGNGYDGLFSTNARYESRKYSDVTNLQYLGDILLWNLRAGIARDRWEVTGFVNNILNDLTPTGDIRGSDLTVPAYATGSPRSFQLGLRRQREAGLSFAYRF